ncbi:PREDICTED: LOW QUALITY PROTEIN: natural killer cell receptor 2B4-like, partial [Fulmarus glacialis]|uniref:LOW QUALITY PROTEIN: natural killer cell receptor 2B4-like n=1 Tax=Fulmarus glacialis TaxID=30455 RepID=UPI00051B62C5
PVRQPRLEARILHQEQGRCNLSLVCTVPGAGNVSYSWSCSGDPPGALEHQPWLHPQVHGDTDPTVCRCNASNPVSWSTASTDIAAACRAAAPGLFSIVPWWAVAVSLGLALAISVALVVTCYRRRKRGKDPPGGHVEQTLTDYREVGKARTSRDPNGTSEATVQGNTIYAVICTKPLGPSHPQEPESCTIYSTVQPTRKVRLPHRSRFAPQSPSLRRKRLDPALVSTAYVEVTGTGRWGDEPWGSPKLISFLGPR